jgi:ABC-2 type transport system permease protein
MLLAGLMAFVAGILVGYLALPQTSSENVMLIWDGIVLLFLFFWMTELMVELQRSELLSLDKFLHLPVSLGGAFLINYVGSISSVGAVIFLPLMVGLAIGLVFSKGPIMLLMFPLIAAFALMITALTHQFRGWLASLMVNQRRRRTVISMATLIFVLIVQTPNLIGFASGRWRSRPGTERAAQIARETQEVDQALATREITPEEHSRRVREIRGRDRVENWKVVQDIARVANHVIPLGWLPYGTAATFDGKALPGLLGIAGLTLIGVGSLRRSYRTTLRLYTGQFTAGSRHPSSDTRMPASPTLTGRYPAQFMEKRISSLSEQASAVTFACFRSLVRAPEAKLLLLSPIIMTFVFGGMFFNQQTAPPELLRPLIVSGAFLFIFFMTLGIMGNQFGFDRSGFRVYVLAPVPRKDILLGKNLSMAPFLFGFMMIFAVLLQIINPMRIDHFLGVVVQMVPMFLVFCMLGNILSTIAPMPTAAGSMKPVKPKAATMLIHFAFVFLSPIALAPTLIPLGIEFLLSRSGGLTWFPAYLIFTVVECAVVVWLYPRILNEQGRLLERRERRILEIVTTKSE